jgi:(p)ppGpp synthase/HD superfamily hydrolase
VQIERARLLATVAHAGQVDKIGVPYLRHPEAVAAIVQRLPEFRDLSTTERMVAVAGAWLHDTVEDTGVTLDMLIELDFPPRVVTVVARLTKRNGITREEYLQEIASDETARLIKIADGMHNTTWSRLERITDPAIRARQITKGIQTFTLLGKPHLAGELRSWLRSKEAHV